jgi:hypothetical protein
MQPETGTAPPQTAEELARTVAPNGNGNGHGAAPDDEDPRALLAIAAASDLEAARYAHWRGRVTFHDVATTWFHMSDPELPAQLRDEFKAMFPGLLDAFAQPRDGIITAYFCRHIRVAAALTDIGHAADASEGVPTAALRGPPPAAIRELLAMQGVEDDDRDGIPDVVERPPGRLARLWLRVRAAPHLFEPPTASSSAIHLEPTFGDPVDAKAKEILFQCLHLHYKALEFLTPQPRKICMRLIFGVITSLLGTLDSRKAHGVTGPLEVSGLERELRQAKDYYTRSAQRQAQLEYLLGMVGCLVVAGIPLLVAAILTHVLSAAITVAVIGGASGALVSVMNRMTNGRLTLRPESGKKAIRALGVMRPIIGAMFGAVAFLFLEGGILQVLESPRNANLAFWAGLGFVAGFSERFAQDAIASVAIPGARTAPEPSPSAAEPVAAEVAPHARA